MTETTPIPVPVPKKPRTPFEKLRIDPAKATGGVWVEHYETKDRFLIRRWWCAEHSRAYLQAVDDYEAKHGKGSSTTPEGRDECEAVAMATGIIIDWKIANDPDLPYDASMMTSCLVDPGLVDLRHWLQLSSNVRTTFAPGDHVVGN